MTTRDAGTGQQTLDSREAALSMVNEDGEWVISEVDVRELPQPPPHR
jgi:hypothetical protein